MGSKVVTSNESGRALSSVLLGLPLIASGIIGFWAQGCLDPRPTAEIADAARCATCHGDPNRPGDHLFRAAPPRDLFGSTDVSYPGVGAHQVHLRGSATHAAIACVECHKIPERVDSAGHADTAGPAELTFGLLAKSGGRSPAYDDTRSCRDTYCHRDADAVWTAPRDSAKACGSCHGLPPAAPHPESDRCSACHAQVVDAARRFIAPDLHVNGIVEFAAGPCTSCHGSGDDPAPPLDTRGNAERSLAGVGAHQAHLKDNPVGRPLACTECHVVPDRVEAPGHANGLPADVVLSSVATSGGHDGARYDAATRTCADTWCHGSGSHGHATSPEWTSAASLTCASCHGDPPAPPHPQMAECSRCHGAVVGADNRTISDPMRHVDGQVDVAVRENCTGCHGSVNAAPPVDTSGRTSTTVSGVGAHQTHVIGTSSSRPVACNECHVVPDQVLDSAHIDSARPAEVSLTKTARAFGGAPDYVAGTCRDTSCHGAVFPDRNDSGGSKKTPAWTRVGGGEAACGSCHALPPPAPHPYASLNPVCNKCHEDIAPDNVTFVRPDLHVDGVVTFAVP